jgi:BTB/POZ domain
MLRNISESFQYGPQSNQRVYQGHSNTAATRTQSAVITPQHIQQMHTPPPPYSQIDAMNPVVNNARSNVISSSRVQSSSLTAAPAVPPKSSNVPQASNRTVPLSIQQMEPIRPQTIIPSHIPSKMPPPIPPLPQSNPYKWSCPEVRGSSKPLEVKIKPRSNSSTPKQTPSPGYESSNNPYVWVKKPTRKTIDLDLELPKIKQAIKDNNVPSFQHFNKELNKNKPLSEVRKAMVNTNYLSDITFIVGDKVIPGHKMIIITASFLFYDHFHVKGETEMKVDGIDTKTFEKVLNYCYTDKIQVTESDVLELLLASSKLQVRQITNVCHGFVSNMMNTDSIFMIFDKALEIGNEVFQKKCIDFINNNEVKCFSSKGFFAVSLPSLVKMLEVCKYPREKISNIVEKWTNGSMGMFEDTSSAQPTPVDVKLTGAVKKPHSEKKKPKKQQQKPKPLIPDLMSLSIPHQPMMSPFSFPPPPLLNHSPSMYTQQFNPNPMAQLVTIDDDGDQRSIISKDDETVKVNVIGSRHQWATEFSRLDFVCKRSMLIHEIGFSEDLSQKCKELRVTVCAFDQNKRSDIHNRIINNTSKKGKNIVPILKIPANLNAFLIFTF